MLVNNAGVYIMNSLEEFVGSEYEIHYNLNSKFLVFCCKAAVAAMPESGGSIVNISSV